MKATKRRTARLIRATIIALVACQAGGALAGEGAQRYQIGRPATPKEIAGWDIDIRGEDGQGLPKGSGSVAQGEALYAERCALCHGDFGEGVGRYPEVMGGTGSLATADPIRSVGSFWPYAPVLFDYIRRTMPFPAPQSLSSDETYALVAYLLHINDIVPKDTVLDAKSLANVRMPNRAGFVPDPRPDVKAERCMKNCSPDPVKVISDVAERQGVTPKRTGD
jgi:cytochrome c